jgi:hypothetical protein
MPLRSARLTGDPVLENCLNGQARMQSGDDSLSVKRLQSGLLAVGRSVGPGDADGIFGAGTATAVTNYKTDKRLVPNDPIVGPGTTKALDDDLFIDPPILDPTFAEFSPFVVDHRLEQFVASELSGLLHAPLDSFRHMLGNFALTNLNSGSLLGIVAGSRGTDLQTPFLLLADAVQDHPQFGLVPADQFFDDAITLGAGFGNTATYTVGGVPRSLIVIHDVVILGRAFVEQTSTGKKAKETLQSVVVHELTHARNIAGTIIVLSIADSDTNTYSDTQLAARSSATGRATADVLRSFVHEMTARHVEWAILKEQEGIPGSQAIRALGAGQLAAAARFYFVDTTLFISNGYVLEIRRQGDKQVFDQLAKWLAICATQSFSDNPADNRESTLAFQAAAQFCADRVANPTPITDTADGLFPLPQHFT